MRDRLDRIGYDNLKNLGNEFYEEKVRKAFPNLKLPKSEYEMKSYFHAGDSGLVLEGFSSKEEFLLHVFNGKRDVFIKVGGSSQLVMQTENPKKIYLFDSHRSENKVFDKAGFLLHLNATYTGAEIMYY